MLTAPIHSFACAQLDLLVGNWYGSNELYRNDGHGIFTLMSGVSVAESLAQANVVMMADLDNDGDLEIIIGNDGRPDEAFFFEHCPAAVRIGASQGCLSRPAYAQRPINTDQSFECGEHRIGSAILERCQDCPPGFERALGGQSCTPCAVGYAQTNGVASACVRYVPRLVLCMVTISVPGHSRSLFESV